MNFFVKYFLVFSFSQVSTLLISQIEYTDRVPDEKITSSQNVTVDLDKDGKIDFEFRLKVNHQYDTYQYIFDVINKNATEVAVNDGSASVIQYGDSIDENLLWNPSYAVNMLNIVAGYEESGNWLNVQNGFLGLRIKTGNQYIYGWLRIHLVGNYAMWVVDYACEMEIDNPISAGQGIPSGATSLFGKDLDDFFDGRDIYVSFTRAFDEVNFKEYRIILAKADDTTALDLHEMNQVGEDNYYSVLIDSLDGSHVVSRHLLTNTTDKEGDSIKGFVKYRIHLLNVAANGDLSDNNLSFPSPEFSLQSYTQAATELVAWDNGNNNSADDVNFSFTRATKDWDISEYRVFLGKPEEIANFNIQTALSRNENYYTSIPPDTTYVISSLNANQLDINGNSIKAGNYYQAIVLTLADSIYSITSTLSLPSRQFSLNNPNNIVAGQETGNQLATYNCDSLFSNYTSWIADTDSIYIDMNRDGLADFRLTGLDLISPMFFVLRFKINPERNNKILCCSHENHDKWIDVLFKNEAITQEYNWVNEESIFINAHMDSYSGINYWYGHGGYDELYHADPFYIGFCIMDNPDKPQYGWLYLEGTKFTTYAFQDFENSFEETKISDEFTLYPNPASGYILIKTNQPLGYSNQIKVKIYNSMGIKIQYFELLKNCQIDISNYPVGIYYCVIKKGNNFSETHKFIVN